MSTDRSQATASAALRHIEDQNHVVKLQQQGVSDVISMGLAFNGQQVAVRTASL